MKYFLLKPTGHRQPAVLQGQLSSSLAPSQFFCQLYKPKKVTYQWNFPTSEEKDLMRKCKPNPGKGYQGSSAWICIHAPPLVAKPFQVDLLPFLDAAKESSTITLAFAVVPQPDHCLHSGHNSSEAPTCVHTHNPRLLSLHPWPCRPNLNGHPSLDCICLGEEDKEKGALHVHPFRKGVPDGYNLQRQEGIHSESQGWRGPLRCYGDAHCGALRHLRVAN